MRSLNFDAMPRDTANGPVPAAPPTLLQVCIDAMPHELWIMDPSGHYMFQNRASQRSWGNLVGRTLDAVEAPKSDLEKWKENDARVLDGQHIVGHFVRRVGPLQHRFVDVMSPVIDRDVTAILGMNIDEGSSWLDSIDATASDDDRLRRQVEDIELRTRGFAHDLNNVFTSIMGSATLAAHARSRSDVDRHLGVIEEVTAYAANFTRQLLDHADTDGEPGIVDMRRAVERAIKTVRPTLAPRVSLDLDLGHRSVVLTANATHIDRIVANLVTNANDALVGEGGTIRVALRTEVTTTAAGGQVIAVLSVEDTGCGIEDVRLSRIFEPRESSKSEGRGLGLWIVRDLVETLGGSIRVKSRVGAGTRFEVTVPISG